MKRFAGEESSSPQLLSIVIPALNAEDTICEQFEALRNQNYDGDWEIILVNNGSTDRTVEIVEHYQQLMPNLRLVHALKARRRTYAYNEGSRAARGTALIFCDADDIVAPGWLNAIAEALKVHNFVAGALDLETLNHSAPWRPPPSTGGGKKMMGFLPFVMTCNLAVSKENFDAVGGFTEELPSGGDADLSWRLQLSGCQIYDASDAVVYYRYRTTLRGLWKQHVRFGYANPLLYRRFAPYGLPESSVRKAFRMYKKILKKMPIIFFSRNVDQQEKALWICQAGSRVGRLLGSIRYRTLYL
ncbi:MAG: glycosyltransferase [Anaerolineae bacterium]|nr:glycosyltransferase [Anaerolineae bacterium]